VEKKKQKNPLVRKVNQVMKKAKFSSSLIIKLFFLQRFFHHFIFFWSVDKIFFAQRGVDPLQLSILLVFWAVYEMIFEMPTGILADRWSRKWLLVISSFFHASAYLIWIFSHNFWMFLSGYALRGTGGVLESGTKQAFLYDHLKNQGKEKEFEKITGRIWVITTVSFLATALVAGWLVDRFSFALVLILSVISNLLGAIIMMLIPDTPKTKSTEEVSHWQFFKRAWQRAVKQPILLRAFLYTAIVLIAYWSLDEYDQLYIDSLGLPIRLFGLWWLIRMSCEGLGGWIAFKFKKFGVQKVLVRIALVNTLILFISGLTSSFLVLPLLGIMFGLFSIAEILNTGLIQKHIPSHERATTTSISTFFGGTTGIIASLIFGYLAKITNPRIGFLTFGVMILLYFVILPIITKEKSSPREA